MLARLDSRDSRWWAGFAHYVSLALAFGFLCWVTRHQWFNVDEWAFLVDRGSGADDVGIFEPHNEHWSTIPVLGYRLLFEVFGLRTYLPYLIVLFAFHLLIAHLLWRILRRIGIAPWFATTAAGLFAVLGVGYENLTSAFQWQLVGALATGLAAVLVAPPRGALERRDALVVVLLVLGLMFSGIGLTMVAVVALVCILRRRVGATVVVVAVPALVYGVWYLAYGKEAADAPLQEPLSRAIQQIPAFVWEGLTGAIDGATGLVGVGVVTLALLTLWTIRRRDPLAEPGPIWIAMAAGAVVFLALTTIRRSGLGIETASSSRYAYVVVALLIPGVALALDPLLRRGVLGRAALVLGGLGLLLVQVSTLNAEAQASAVAEQEQRQRIVATADLAESDVEVLSPVPVPVFAPNLSVEEIAELDRDGDLPDVAVDDADRLTARAYLQVVEGPEPLVTGPPPELRSVRGGAVEPAPRPECARVVPESSGPVLVLDLADDAAFTVRTSIPASLEVRLSDGDAVGRARTLPIAAGTPRTISVVGAPVELRLTVPGFGDTEICGIEVSSAAGADTAAR